MSRSTIQDKLSGKNPPRLGQIMALVQACADYAGSIGAPLTAEDTDEQVWRARAAKAASVQTSPPVPERVPASTPPVPEDAMETLSPKLDVAPLIRAGMYDMVDLIHDHEDKPMSGWLPTLVAALRTAGMSNDHFLQAASGEQPKEVVVSIEGLTYYEEHGACNRLIYLCVLNQPAKSIPAILALLRRTCEDGIKLANKFIDTIIDIGDRSCAIALGPDGCADIVRALWGATMDRDATRLLEGIGAYGLPGFTLKMAELLTDTKSDVQAKIFSSAGKGSRYHISSLLKALRKTRLDVIDPKNALDCIISGIPYEKHEEIASFLKSVGLNEEAARCLEYFSSEPPF